MKPSIEALREAFDYDAEGGHLIWRRKRRRGQIAGSMNDQGYILINFRWKGVRYHLKAHSVAVAMVTGEWSKSEIDHRNGVGSDNRWDNLREAATRSEQMQNKVLNEFGGTYPSGSKWIAKICIDREHLYLGTFETREEAHQAYLEAKAKLHSFQPNPRFKDSA